MKSSASSGSATTCGITVNSAAAANVGGTPSGWPNSAAKAATRAGSTTNGTGG